MRRALLTLALSLFVAGQASGQSKSILFGGRTGFGILAEAEGADFATFFVGADARVGVFSRPVFLGTGFDWYPDADGRKFYHVSLQSLFYFIPEIPGHGPYLGFGLSIYGFKDDSDFFYGSSGSFVRPHVLVGKTYGTGTVRPFFQVSSTFPSDWLVVISTGILVRVGGDAPDG